MDLGDLNITFPMMNSDELTLILNKIGIKNTDLTSQNFKGNLIYSLIPELLEYFTGCTYFSFSKPVIKYFSIFSYPELHEDSVKTILTCSQIQRMFFSSGFKQFSIFEFELGFSPSSQFYISGIINLAKFREDNLTYLRFLDARCEKAYFSLTKDKIKLEIFYMASQLLISKNKIFEKAKPIVEISKIISKKKKVLFQTLKNIFLRSHTIYCSCFFNQTNSNGIRKSVSLEGSSKINQKQKAVNLFQAYPKNGGRVIENFFEKGKPSIDIEKSRILIKIFLLRRVLCSLIFFSSPFELFNKSKVKISPFFKKKFYFSNYNRIIINSLRNSKGK